MKPTGITIRLDNMKTFAFIILLIYSIPGSADDTKMLFCDVEGLKYKMAAEMRDSKKTKNESVIKLSKIINRPLEEINEITNTVFDEFKTKSPEWLLGYYTALCVSNFPEAEADTQVRKQT